MRFTTLCLAAIALCAGCSGKDKDLKGTSTRKASAEEMRQHRTQEVSAEQRFTSFGEPMKLSERDAVPVATVLQDPAAHDGRYVRLVGNVTKVCTAKGCWMEMADPATNQAMFVKFTCPIEGRLIPMEAIGKPATVEGTVQVKQISEEEARHLKEESGAGADDVQKIVGPQKQITLASPAARIEGM